MHLLIDCGDLFNFERCDLKHITSSIMHIFLFWRSTYSSTTVGFYPSKYLQVERSQQGEGQVLQVSSLMYPAELLKEL